MSEPAKPKGGRPPAALNAKQLARVEALKIAVMARTPGTLMTGLCVMAKPLAEYIESGTISDEP